MEEFKPAAAAKNRLPRTAGQSRRNDPPSLTPIPMEGVRCEHSELFGWLADYHHAVEQGAGRNDLLAIFDATLECVRMHFLRRQPWKT